MLTIARAIENALKQLKHSRFSASVRTRRHCLLAMGDVYRVCQGVFDCGHAHPRRRADAFCHRPNRTLTEAARLADHFDGNKVRDLSSKLNRFAVDRNVAHREPLHRGYLEGRSEGVAGIAAQDLPVRLRIRSIRRLPTISR